MTEDPFNMSMRTFLRQVGATSQQRQALRTASPAGPVKASAITTIPELETEHAPRGDISCGEIL